VKRGSVVPAAATSNKAPNAPTIVIGAPSTDASSLFLAGDAGDYIYQVTAINRFGESLPSAASAATTMAAGEIVTVTITDTGGVNPATGYKVYRTEVDGTVTYFIGIRTARATAGGVPTSPTVFTDINSWRPRMFIGLLLDMSTQSITFRQLSPMMKMNLAVLSPAIRWMQLLYGTPIMYAPSKNVLIKNIAVA